MSSRGLFSFFHDLLPQAAIPVQEEHRRYNTVIDTDGLTVNVDLPGVKRDDLTVEMLGNILVIDGTRGTRKFKHRYTISSDFDASSCDATLADGVLSVHLKRYVPQTTRVPFKVTVK